MYYNDGQKIIADRLHKRGRLIKDTSWAYYLMDNFFCWRWRDHDPENGKYCPRGVQIGD